MADNGQKAPIGELMIRENLITEKMRDEAVERKKKYGGKFGENLVAVGAIDEWTLTLFLARHFGLSPVNLDDFNLKAETMRLAPKELILKYNFVPLTRVGSELTIATSDPEDMQMANDIIFSTGASNITMLVASPGSIKSQISNFFNLGADAFQKIMTTIAPEDIEYDESREENEQSATFEGKTDENSTASKLVNEILAQAAGCKASDIHIEPFSNALRVRYRIDGKLHVKLIIPRNLASAVTSIIKLRAGLKIDEKRRTQDGRIKMRLRNTSEVEFRVGVIPTINGEKIALRLMDKSNVILKLDDLGFEDQTLKIFRQALHRPTGIVLVTGPTGSGKTTTLYAALNELNKEDVHILTVEDPVEISLKGINQVQVNPAVDLNFAECLREFLRQDPNIILVGEIRDFETAETAIKAAMTGHLVLSTLHTNDAPSTISRLIDIGIEPHLINAGVRMVLAQRLIRMLCPKCKVEAKNKQNELIALGLDASSAASITIYESLGCINCAKTGYSGRKAIYEVMPMTEQIQQLIHNGASASEIRNLAIRQGMATLRQAALAKLKAGLTSIEEVLRWT
ncbi:MAG: ATPase, T2SS/T4P/T4SS family [Parcubacteria group bacterium]